MTYDDKELFNQAMEDVRPLKQHASVVYLAAKSPPPQRPAPARPSQENFLITELFAPQPCDTPLYFKQDSIQQGLIDKLGHGKYLIGARLNITRMPVMRARALLFEFMERVTQEECRTLLIIHGRGPSDDSHANRVRSFVARWLTQFVQVQAYCCAQPAHGGAGAYYVALRKSARARGENRERHARRLR